MKYLRLIALFSFIFSTTAIAGPIYVYEATNPNHNKVGGEIEYLKATYDPSSEIFTWESIIGDNNNGQASNGFWLAVNDGPNPKQGVYDELAILYGDGNTGLLNIYTYNPDKGGKSYQNGDLLGTTTLGVTRDNIAGTTTYNFDLDVSSINQQLSKGISFYDMIGIWFHTMVGAVFDYQWGELIDVSFDKKGWFDRKNLDADVVNVSAPSVISLIAISLALIAFGLRRRVR